jgi:hypothetical protein
MRGALTALIIAMFANLMRPFTSGRRRAYADDSAF